MSICAEGDLMRLDLTLTWDKAWDEDSREEEDRGREEEEEDRLGVILDVEEDLIIILGWNCWGEEGAGEGFLYSWTGDLIEGDTWPTDLSPAVNWAGEWGGEFPEKEVSQLTSAEWKWISGLGEALTFMCMMTGVSCRET